MQNDSFITVLNGRLGNGFEVANFTAPYISGPHKISHEQGKLCVIVNTSDASKCSANIGTSRKNARIFFNNMTDIMLDSVEAVQSNVSNIVIEPIPEKTDEELKAEIDEKFEVLDLMIEGVSDGFVRSLAVAGDAGTGKSYSTHKILENSGIKFSVLKGSVSAIMLYIHLFNHSDKHQVLVLDDVELWQDIEAVALLKAVLDTGKKRIVSWSKMSSFLDEQGIPNSFEFNGAVIFLSNMNFNREIERNSKMAPHLSAILSRSHFISVNLNSIREKLIRIMSICNTDDFRFENKLSVEQSEEILQWVSENGLKLREVSIRTVVKVADMMHAKPMQWQRICKHTLCK